MGEIWKDIEGFEGLYQVSNFGRVKRLYYEFQTRAKNGATGTAHVAEHVLNHRRKGKGYDIVALRKDGKSFDKSVHRLVAEAFIPNPDNLPWINHKDENPSNNRVENLEWCTPAYNLAYNGLRKRSMLKRSKPVVINRPDGSEVHEFNSVTDAAHFIGCGPGEVWDCAAGQRVVTREGDERVINHHACHGWKVRFKDGVTINRRVERQKKLEGGKQ